MVIKYFEILPLLLLNHHFSVLFILWHCEDGGGLVQAVEAKVRTSRNSIVHPISQKRRLWMFVLVRAVNIFVGGRDRGQVGQGHRSIAVRAGSRSSTIGGVTWPPVEHIGSWMDSGASWIFSLIQSKTWTVSVVIIGTSWSQRWWSWRRHCWHRRRTHFGEGSSLLIGRPPSCHFHTAITISI